MHSITMRAFDTVQKLHEDNQVIRSFWEASTLMVYTTLKKRGWLGSEYVSVHESEARLLCGENNRSKQRIEDDSSVAC